MSAKFIFLKGRSHVTLNMHPRIPAQTSAALTKALAAVLMAASVRFKGFPAIGQAFHIFLPAALLTADRRVRPFPGARP